MEGYNSNYNTHNSSNSNIKSEMSITKVVKEVSQLMSNCRLNVTSRDAVELHQCLPLLNDILSEIANLVMITQQQQPLQHDEELVWDSSHDYYVYSDVSPYCSSSSMISSDSDTSFVDSEAEERKLMEEIFIGGMVEAINKAAPGNIFNAKKSEKKRLEKKRRKIIPKMLRTIWLNCTEFQTTTTYSVPSVRTPVINWSQVNKRAFDNLPKTKPYPVHGCSQDPEFYKEHYKYEFGENRVVQAKHSGDYPFGCKHGYMTQYGVVSVGVLPAPVHGFDIHTKPFALAGSVCHLTLIS